MGCDSGGGQGDVRARDGGGGEVILRAVHVILRRVDLGVLVRAQVTKLRFVDMLFGYFGAS